MRLLGARIGGQLKFAAAVLRNGTGPALGADGIQVEGSVLFTDGFTIDGAVRLADARIGGQVVFDGGTLHSDSGRALEAGGVQVDGSLILGRGLVATGGVGLGAAHVGGQLDCSGAELVSDAGPALNGDRLQVEGNVLLIDGFTATGAGRSGALRLTDARIGRQLDCTGAVVRNETGPAMHADAMQVHSNAFFNLGFTATGAGEPGAVRLLGARVSGQLSFEGATVRNDTGPSLAADGLQVAESLHLSSGFRSLGVGEHGAIRLPGARISGQLSFEGATVRNSTGPALVADGLEAQGGLFLRAGFTAEGVGQDGVLRLPGSRIGISLDCTGGQAVGHGQTITLDLRHAVISGRLCLPTGFASRTVASDSEGEGELRTTADGLVQVDGLTYSGLPAGASLHDWLLLLGKRTPSYSGQPYQQLAAVHRAAGHDGEVRQILMAQRRDQIDRALTGRWERAWARLTGVTLGYGYQPWRALIGLAAVLVAAAALTVLAGAEDVAAHTKDYQQGSHCSLVEQVGLGIDLAAPLISSSIANRCQITTTRTAGQLLTAGGWILQLLAWAFATLFVAGFTGAVRKT